MKDGRVELRRRLLGYDPSAVEQLLADRDAMITAVALRAKEAEARAEDLERELARRDEEMAALRQQVEQLANDVWAALEERTRTPEPRPASAPMGFVSEELSRVVRAAEESAGAIIRRAWEATREQIAEVERLWSDVQEEVLRFAAWRQQVEPMIDSVRESIREANQRIAAVPERILEAVRPAVEAMAAVDRGISAFAEASALPVILGRLGPEEGQEQGREGTPAEGPVTAEAPPSPQAARAPGEPAAVASPSEVPVDVAAGPPAAEVLPEGEDAPAPGP
ncbi:MAG TPA: hypothetical protein VNO34_08580, partial [Actinomycetota bacterium]|nr:hypothetical protein [Actinomycetota bacterium]